MTTGFLFNLPLPLPLACSGPQGAYAMRQSGEVLRWCLGLCLTGMVAIIIGAAIRQRFGLRPMAAVGVMLALPVAVTAIGDMDCGTAARGFGYIACGLMAGLCAGEFLFWRQTRALDRAQRKQKRPTAAPDTAADAALPTPVDEHGLVRAALAQSADGWDAAAHSAVREPEDAAKAMDRLRRQLGRRTWQMAPAIALLVGILAWLVIPTVLAPDRTIPDFAMSYYLYWLPDFQNKYRAQTGNYGGSIQALQDAKVLPDGFFLQNAFEPSDGNRDAQVWGVLPVYGYRFKMLHGTVSHPLAWCVQSDPEKLTHWAVIGRRDQPTDRVQNQLLISDGGQMYRHPEPPVGDPHYQRFLFDALPDGILLPDGSLDPVPLAALGWKPVDRNGETTDFEAQ